VHDVAEQGDEAGEAGASDGASQLIPSVRRTDAARPQANEAAWLLPTYAPEAVRIGVGQGSCRARPVRASRRIGLLHGASCPLHAKYVIGLRRASSRLAPEPWPTLPGLVEDRFRVAGWRGRGVGQGSRRAVARHAPCTLKQELAFLWRQPSLVRRRVRMLQQSRAVAH
jgi:hypothetical protein